MARTRSAKNVKFKFTTPRSKVKCQKFSYCCTWELIGSSLIPLQIKSAKTCKWPWPTFLIIVPRSKVKYLNWPAYAHLWDKTMLYAKYQVAAIYSSWDIVRTKNLLWRSLGQGHLQVLCDLICVHIVELDMNPQEQRCANFWHLTFDLGMVTLNIMFLRYLTQISDSDDYSATIIHRRFISGIQRHHDM